MASAALSHADYAPIFTGESEQERSEREYWEQVDKAAAPFIQELIQNVTVAVRARGPVEQRWLKNLRQYHGVYESGVLDVLRNDDTRSRVFINITRPKTNAWAARLGDMLFPNDEKNWGINPTPVPDLTESARKFAAEIVQHDMEAQAKAEEYNQQVDQQQQGGPPPDQALVAQAQQSASLARELRQRERAAQTELEVSRRCAEKMEREIDDQLTECRWPARCRDVIDDMTKVGIGVMKGPSVVRGGRKTWQETEGGFALIGNDTVRPSARRVNYWHFFPDPSAETIEEAEYVFERHLPNKKTLRKMAKDMGFYPHAVRELIKEGPQASTQSGANDLNFLQELRNIDADAAGDIGTSLNDRFVVWEYHGALENDAIVAMLRATGRLDDASAFERDADPLSVKMVRVFFCGTKLLRISEEYPMDSGECIYSVATFEKAETSILGGVGVPELMKNEQAMLNSAVRMIMDNAALAVGPQVVIDKEQIEPENGQWKLTPRKVWQWKATVGRQQRETPFATFNIPMNQEMLAGIIQLATKFVDEAVSMPLIAQGDQGDHITKTKGGMSMLFNSANVVFRRVIKNWDDDLTAPVIARYYDFNMQFSDKDDIKGDMKVEARGTSVLLVREMQAEQLLNIVQTFSTHPIIGVALKAYNCMRLVLQAMSINPNDVLIDEEEYLDKLHKMSQSEDDVSPETIRAQSAIQVAEIDAQSRQMVAESNERIADMRMKTEMIGLASKENLTLQQITAMFEGKKFDAIVRERTAQMQVDSAERKQAAEIGAERQNAVEARAAGLEPTGSGGSVSFGATAAPH